MNADYNESAYRKKYQSFQRIFNANRKNFIKDENILDEITKQKRELEMAKVAYRDERNAWSKQNRIAARVKQKLDYLENQISSIGKIHFPAHDTPIINSDNDLLVCCSDLHIGATFNSIFGEYSSDIAKNRLNEYLREILRIQKRHNSENVHLVLLGDEISGNIHKSIAITNRENVIEQVKSVSELIASFCDELSAHFNHVTVYSVSGNHSRIDNKEDALHDERLDDLVTFVVKKILSNSENISFRDGLDIGISDMTIRNNIYLAVHGDNDCSTQAGVMRLCSMIGIFPTGIIMGHNHTPAFSDINGIKIVQSGCLCGSGDQYTIAKRLYGKPSQTVCVCSDKGIECIYPVEL